MDYNLCLSSRTIDIYKPLIIHRRHTYHTSPESIYSSLIVLKPKTNHLNNYLIPQTLALFTTLIITV